jgi:hypothetical protein
VHHLVNWDDWHLLAHAMASDFSAAWQCLSKRTFFLLRIKLHALIRLGVSPPSFDTGARNAVLCGSQLCKPLISEENWPGQGLNPGLPNDTPALYPLLYELMLNILCSFGTFFPILVSCTMKNLATLSSAAKKYSAYYLSLPCRKFESVLSIVRLCTSGSTMYKQFDIYVYVHNSTYVHFCVNYILSSSTYFVSKQISRYLVATMYIYSPTFFCVHYSYLHSST